MQKDYSIGFGQVRDILSITTFCVRVLLSQRLILFFVRYVGFGSDGK